MWFYRSLKKKMSERLHNLRGPSKDGEKAIWGFAIKAFEAGDMLCRRTLDPQISLLGGELYLREFHTVYKW